MVKLAREYHSNLQQKGIDTNIGPQEQSERTENALNEILTTQKLSTTASDKLNWSLLQDQVMIALKSMKNGMATGLDRCPYNLWKTLDECYKEDKEKKKKKTFDIILVLATVFADIQSNGVDKRTEFAEGWMCPIYKKKDPMEIENYRPITLLNTDYKLLTRTMALLLMKPIRDLIHQGQVGFIPKRQIFDHIRLAKTVLTYAETMEVDGMIVALYQEKAYDKIRHDYLWETLTKFNLPEVFMNTVRSLYENAHTQVAINGVMSEPFKVTRGVCQGDPLSCLLFDMAIEPLACKIRNSKDIEGLNIPGLQENIKINLFADDTTLYLNKNDRLDNVENILDEWCETSGAKFNLEKTEIIPFGTATHRANIIAARKVNCEDEKNTRSTHKSCKRQRGGMITRSMAR